MSFRRIGGINRSSNNHIVTSEYNTSSNSISQNTFVGDLNCNNIVVEDISINGNIFISNSSNIQVNFESDMSFNTLDVSDNLTVNNQATIYNAIINNNLDVSENLTVNKQATIYNLDISNILTANVITVQTLNINSTLNLSDASINHLDINSHLFAPEVSFNNLDVLNHLFAPEVSFNKLDVSNNLYANDASINNLDVSDNLTVNGNAVFNGTFTLNNIDISSQILGINSGESTGNIGLMMQTDSSNVFFGYDASENMCFITKTSYGPDTSFNVFNTLDQDSSANLRNNLVNLQVNELKAQNIVYDNFTVSTNNFNNITVNDNATIRKLSVQENINCGKAIKLENNTFSVGSMVNVYKSGNIANLEADYDIYVTDKWAIYVFDNSGNYTMNLNVLEENGEIPDISLGYIICGGGEGGGTGTSDKWGRGGAPGYVKYDFKDISSNGDIIFNIKVGEGGESSEADLGGMPGTYSLLQVDTQDSSFNFDASGGSDDNSSTTLLISYNLNNTLCIKNDGIVAAEDGQFIIKLGGAGGDSYVTVDDSPTIIDASFGGGGGGGGGTSSEWGIKGTKKNKIVVNNELITSTDFELGISGENSGENGGAGGDGNFGGGGGGGGTGGTGGKGGKGGNGVVCIIIDKAKFGSVIKDVEEMQCGTLSAFQIETTKLKTKSDYRLKTNVEDLQEVYNVDKLRPVMYNINSSKEIGLIAHEIQEYYPFLVSGVKDGKEMQTVNYNGLIGVLIKEIQLLKSVVKEQSELVREQGNEIKLLKNGNN
jgi:hypothetical protein